MYIGSKKITKTKEDGNNVFLTFGDKTTTSINKDLLELVQTEKEGNGNVGDVVTNKLAKKFLAEMASYDLDRMNAVQVGQSIGVLVDNLLEDWISKESGSDSGSLGIKLINLL